MIYQNEKKGNPQNQILKALKELQVGKRIRKSNITNSYGIFAYEVFQFLLLVNISEKEFIPFPEF